MDSAANFTKLRRTTNIFGFSNFEKKNRRKQQTKQNLFGFSKYQTENKR
jgi:hypothetical protein